MSTCITEVHLSESLPVQTTSYPNAFWKAVPQRDHIGIDVVCCYQLYYLALYISQMAQQMLNWDFHVVHNFNIPRSYQLFIIYIHLYPIMIQNSTNFKCGTTPSKAVRYLNFHKLTTRLCLHLPIVANVNKK